MISASIRFALGKMSSKSVVLSKKSKFINDEIISEYLEEYITERSILEKN